MKYNYCPNCKKAYVKSRLEKDRCIYCNSYCETVDVKRNNLYYFGYSLMLLGAGSALIPRFIAVSGTIFFMIMGILLVIAGTAFVMMGSLGMAKAAARIVSETGPEE